MVEDSEYFRDRAEAELSLARSAASEGAARAHYELAGHYWDRAFNPADGIATRSIAANAALIGGLLTQIHTLPI